MRNKETIQKVTAAQNIGVTVKIQKNAVVMEGNFVPRFINKRLELFAYLAKQSKAYVKIENSQRVVNSSIKKIEALGFSIELVERTETNFGLVRHYIVITK